ncbi:TetR family transcriptional regulator [Pseudonocardia acidicola]|uniref:TetR/AcrR family transcriptional regulator n=1 Tax=Pseudonocardia acidicola TaxID=2724939 RepID=A0ABX1SEN2_9PSEU|nr:TetR/AcrR family transcriptional regulator [Pseudonocardia acidicola]
MGQSREARILDAAGELLLVFGYRRVTIEDVARRAGVGKGTVYLHWSSKLELFATVLVRDVAAIVAEQLAALRADPAEVRLHRTMRALFLLVMHRPLARAFYTGDTELLGALSADTKIGRQFAMDKAAMAQPYLSVLHEHGLLADDPGADPGLMYRFSAATTGFFLLERLLPAAGDGDLEAKAGALATTVRRGFEPAADPAHAAIEAAAAAVIDLYEHLLADLTRSLPEENSP